MDSRTDLSRPVESRRRISSTRPGPRILHSWPWLLAGTCATLMLCVVVLELRRVSDTVSDAQEIWWHSSALVAALMTGAILTATAVLLAHQRRLSAHSRDESRRQLHGVAEALSELDRDPASAWRMLRDEKVIDGHALWDADDRLVDFSGFLGRYIPHLADWREPSARQLVTALVDGGHMALTPGLDREQTIDICCGMRRHVPGLRELRMTDGQVYQARTVNLGDGRLATIYTNVTELQRPTTGLIGADVFRQAFEQSPTAKLLLDAQLRPRATNGAFVSLLGHTADAVARLGWRGLLHPEEPADLAPWSVGIHRLLTAQGGTVRAAITAQQLVDDLSGAPGGLLVSLEDVSSRWDAEQRLHLQAAVLEQVGLAVLAVDRDGRIALGNQAACTLFQWSESVLPGTSVERLLGNATRAALANGVAELETEGATWTGNAFPAQVSLSRLGEASPLPGGAVVVVADLTPRRALDLQLMHSARLATLGEMAASIAHEFNQCLHVIRLASEAVELDLLDGRLDADRLGKRTHNILDQVDRLTEMVTHMRAISRRESKDTRPFQPQAAVDAALRMVEPLLKVDGIKVVRDGRLDGMAVLGHQVRLEQVLLNLLNNGRDAIRERFRTSGNTGGTITLTCSTLPEQARLRIAVRDNGTGIASAVGAHIFEPFVTTKDGGNGLGLGLSISRGICTEMGGCLSFGNVEGGAEFVIELPLAPADLAADTPAPAQSCAVPLSTSHAWEAEADEDGNGDEDPGDERRVLLVDDEALSVLMVAEFLTRQGYVVDTAYDGLEAYELCRTHVYHAVITDIRMPRMTGRELIAKLEDLQPGTPVIVVTGHLKESNVADLGTNVVALLAKPFQLQDLREQLLLLDRLHEERQEEGV